MLRGAGAVSNGVQDGSGTVAGLPSLTVSRIACRGRQKSEWYLSFQQLIAVSAPARFSIASRRALSATSTA
jgi:hypothetical protein